MSEHAKISKLNHLGLLVGSALAMGALQADPVVWYRFDGTGDKIENKANPGVNDATLMTIKTWGSLGGLAAYNESSPERESAGWPTGTQIVDTKTAAVHDGEVRALGFTGDKTQTGVAIVYKSGNSSFSAVEGLTTFTCEAFVKVPDSGVSHAATDILFPIVGVGSSISSQNQGWSLCLRNNNNGKGFFPFVRIREKTATSTAQVDLDCSDSPLSVGKWHHVAFVANKKNDSGSGEFRVYLDYKLVKTITASTYYGINFNSASAFPLLVGADLWRVSNSANSACFAGEIAEVRISDKALTCNQMLAPIATAQGPVSENTLVYLPLGENAWFGGADVLSKTGSGITPTWVYGTIAPIAAYPKASVDVKGEFVRDGVYSSEATPETGSLTFSRVLYSGNNYNAHLIKVPCDDLTRDSFTLEFSFKSDAIPSGNAFESKTFLNPSWAKIMINQADGKLKTRLIPETGTYGDWDTSVRVDDGKWHHYALVYDKAVKSFDVYLDYQKQNFGKPTSIELAYSNSSAFNFGGQSVSVQGFAGQLDDLRVTRGKLAYTDFLVNSAYVSSYPLDAQFEGNFASGQSVDFAPDGVGAALGTGNVPTFAERIGVIDLLGEGTYTRKSTQCVSIDGGYVKFANNKLLEVNEFTAEMLAKFSNLASSANLLRFSQGQNVGGTPVWTLYTVNGSLLLTANYLEDGATKSMTGVRIKENADLADGRWHHWALVSAANGEGGYTLTVYRDYEPFGNPATVPGPFAFSAAGNNLSIGGTGVATAHLTGRVCALRVRPEACASTTFMRYKGTQGLAIILR